MAVITVSRQFGSHGDTVVQLLCDRLNYRLFDKNLMLGLGAQFGLSPDRIKDVSADTHTPKSLVERLFGSMQRGPFGHAAGEAQAVEQVNDMLLAAYEQGYVVMVGRGGQVVLAGKPDVLHVRLVAPLELRIERHGKRAGLAPEEARAAVLRRDAGSADFVRQFFGADVADPALYDLVINTAKITPAAATALIIKALERLPAKG